MTLEKLTFVQQPQPVLAAFVVIVLTEWNRVGEEEVVVYPFWRHLWPWRCGEVTQRPVCGSACSSEGHAWQENYSVWEALRNAGEVR